MVLGYDAAGVVVAAGPQATLFKPGDEVFYAGSIMRPGTNAEFHLVDERIVGAKPRTLDFAAAAAMPLTSLTAWEMLFDRFAIARAGGEGKSLLIIGGAGGVGSMAIQLARVLTKLTVIATASRPETTAWCRDLGAHAVIDHGKPIPATARGDRASLRRLRLQHHQYRPALRHHRRGDRAAGQVRADRRSRPDRRQQAAAEVQLAALGRDVHALDLSDAGHRGAASSC